ncbi:rna-binding protein 40-like [Stylonychia lemnae]|uniref:Rna-binding protein 40-like n=1 Tax=Stylonychia lemnae TaxID=5949 RepID=A0A078B0Y1_STYLE|nr:rna-binding protein 40-like [Stylonychia lemnae]|eukprot:CDW88219.1 rna-binding protein 40-like [Stylonychia lemnae]
MAQSFQNKDTNIDPYTSIQYSKQELYQIKQQVVQIEQFEDVDDYLKHLELQITQNDKAQQELQELDYDIWFQKQSKAPDGRVNFQQAKRDKQVTKSLYIKNIDKRGERKDFIKLLLPFFDDDQAKLENEVDVTIMNKGRMRGQGFMNFKDTNKAVEIYDALQGIVIGQKGIQIEFSASGKPKRVKTE